MDTPRSDRWPATTRYAGQPLQVLATMLLGAAMLAPAAEPIEPAIRQELRSLANAPFVVGWQRQVGATKTPPAERHFAVTDFGAHGDGLADCTKSIQNAIDACAESGGGRVEFTPGTYVTGSLFLKSKVELHLGRGVVLLGSLEDARYPKIFTRAGGIELEWPAALLNVRGQENVAITGEGMIDGRGKRWWDRFWAAEPDYARKGVRWAVDYDIGRPHLLQIYESRDVTVRGITLVNSPFWTLHTVFSLHVTIDGVTVNNMIAGTNGPSTDGINVDSSAFVVVENCSVDCNDDCFSFKSGMNADGQRVNLPVQYCLFRNCHSLRGHGGVTIGSDMSGGARHLEAVGFRMDGTQSGIRLKSAAVRGGVVEDVWFHQVQMENVRLAIEMSLNWFPQFSYPRLPADKADIPPHWRTIAQPVPPDKALPTWRNITISDATAVGSDIGIAAEGLPGSPMTGFHLARVAIAAGTAGSIRRAKDWTIDDVRIRGKDGQAVVQQDTTGVEAIGTGK